MDNRSKKFVSDFISRLKDSEAPRALDILYQEVEPMLNAGSYNLINLLNEIRLHHLPELSSTVLVGILTITSWYKHQLSEVRSLFYNADRNF